ncbi:MAG: tyrosine-type recombinase/integrase [Erysipelothrix sp.]|nr:tyrosine-type recombinase/integrase [Erysipelothrix sp.]
MSFSFVCVNLFVIAWEQRRLGEVVDLRGGRDYKHLSSGNIPVYGTGGYMLSVDEALSNDENAIGIGRKGTIDNPFILSAPFWTVDTLFYAVPRDKYDINFVFCIFQNIEWKKIDESTGVPSLSKKSINSIEVKTPNYLEQKTIGKYFATFDNLITLHQRTQKVEKGKKMFNNINKEDTFSTYFAQWITVYKKGAIRDVTLSKYQMTHTWIEKIAPSLRLSEINRMSYQQLLNEYALYHERQTTMDFHHHLKGAILDAVDEGLIDRDPTRKAIIKGKNPREKKPKFLNQCELHTLIKNLKLGDKINWDWLILLVAKTGMRFSEALALTPSDFDFAQQSISISKTWDYKKHGGFLPTKNKSSVRKLQVDWQTTSQFSNLLKNYPKDEPIFVAGRVFNSTVNTILYRHCKQLNIPTITIHGLRHTHASLLLFAGVSIASFARRLGHSSITTTQKTYLHIIHELENQDTDLVIRSLSRLV